MRVQAGEPGLLEVFVTPMQADAMKQIPGAKWDSTYKCWTIPQAYPIWLQFRASMTAQIEISDEVNTWVDEQYRHEIELWHARRSEDADVFHPRTDDLRPAQRVGVDWLRRAGSAILADGMGAGKTVQASVRMGGSKHVLVVCPKSVVRTWMQHVREWTSHTPHLGVGGAKQRLAAIDAWKEQGGVLVMNWEATHLHSRLSSYGAIAFKRCVDHKGLDPKVTPAKCEVHDKELNNFPIDMLVMDEAHRAKDPKSKQTRAVVHLAKSAAIRMPLTGTPVEGKPMDVWPLLHMVNPDHWPSRGKFIDRYCAMTYNAHSGNYEPSGLRPDRAEEWYRIRDMYMLSRTFAEVTGRDIDKVFQTYTVKMAPKQRSVYNKLKTEAEVELDNGQTLVIESDLSATTRLIQASSAAIEVDVVPTVNKETGEVERKQIVRMLKPSPKIDELWRVWNEDMGRAPLVVMAGGPGSRQLLELACAHFEGKGIAYSKIVGGMSGALRSEEEERYMMGATDIFFGQTQAAGEGLSLDRGNTLAFLQRPPSLIQNKQAEDRVLRFTQAEDTVLILDFVTEDTYDDRTVEIYHNKQELYDDVMRDPAKLKELL